MLKTLEMLPGAKIQIKDVIKDGLSGPYMKSEVIDHMRMWVGGIGFLTGTCYAINSGEILTVIAGPKRKDGINVIELKTANELVGHVYWCEARASAVLIEE